MLMALSKWEWKLPVRGKSRSVSSISPWLTPFAYRLLRYWVLPVYFRSIVVEGRENFPDDGCPVILAPTHRARWDSVMVPYAVGKDITGRDLRFMVSATEMTGIQGWLIRRLGGFAINQAQMAIASWRYGLQLLENREMLVIFPEGGIFRDRQVHPLKLGLARLALQAQTNQPQDRVKIVPIALDYDDCFPRWRSSVRIKIGLPLEVSPYLSGEIKADAQALNADLYRALERLGGEVLLGNKLDR